LADLRLPQVEKKSQNLDRLAAAASQLKSGERKEETTCGSRKSKKMDIKLNERTSTTKRLTKSLTQLQRTKRRRNRPNTRKSLTSGMEFQVVRGSCGAKAPCRCSPFWRLAYLHTRAHTRYVGACELEGEHHAQQCPSFCAHANRPSLNFLHSRPNLQVT